MGNFTEYIGSQFGNPRGIIGKICCIIMNSMNRKMYKSIVGNVEIDDASNILDVGYGNGYLIKLLYRKYKPNIYGIDISDDMKNHAIKRNNKAVAEGKVKLEVGNCCELKFNDNSFDTVTSVNTIYFWSNPLVGLSEIHRILKVGGSFYNAVYSKEWLQSLSYTKKGFKLYEKEELILLGKKAGFSKIDVKDIVKGKSYIVQYKK